MRHPVELKKVRRWSPLSGAAFATVLWVAIGAMAAEQAPPARYPIQQASQALSDSLRSIARQTGTSVLFDPAIVNGRVSRPVSGTLSAVEAISRALEGSGLAAEVMADGAIVVRPARRPEPSRAPQAPRTQSAPEAPGAAARQDRAMAQASAAEGPGPARDAARDADVSPSTGQRVEVTGSRLRRVETEGPMPVNVYTRDDISRSGQPTLERFLSHLNEVSMTQGEGAFSGTTGQGSVQLRGLPLGSTLVLVNGRRVQAVGSSSANFFNLGLIPLAAVERVEVVPVGSSAVYGGDALAGVVNVILKSRLDGPALDLRLAAGRGVGDGGISWATGGSQGAGSFLVLGAYNRTTPLTQAERAFFDDADYRRFGGPDARSRSCTPGTVSSTTSEPLPGLGSTLAGIPQMPDGAALTIDAFLPTAGQPNLCNSLANGHGSALVHGTESLSLHAAGELRLSAGWVLFGELTHANDRLGAKEGGLPLNNVLVPASNAYNPLGVPVRVTARLGTANGTQGLERETRYTRLLAGLRGDVTRDWEVEATLSTSRDDGERMRPNATVDTAARGAALSSATPAGALNAFATGVAASDAVLDAIWSDEVRHNHGRKDLVAAFARGTAAELPAGPVEAIVGVEWARDLYDTSIPGSVSIRNSRHASAAFGELRLPILRSGPRGGGGWNLLDLTVAGRRDRYSDFGAASTFQSGLEFRPLRSALLRASAATSFKPPTLLQSSVDEESLATEDFGLVDPARGNEPVEGGEVLRTTNRGLKPERGRAVSLGALWEPAGAGTRIGVQAWRVEIDGLIALLWPQITVDNEALFPGFVTRGAPVDGLPGPIEQVLWAEVNFGRVDSAGIDMELAHAWKAFGGRLLAAASATRTTRYDVVIAPGAPAESRLGKRFADYWAPQWKGRLSVGFDAGAWKLGLTSRYVGRYEDAGTSTRNLGGHWVHDLSGGLDLVKFGIGFGGARAANLTVGVVNLLNRQPEFAATLPYYDVTQADWRGRYANVRLAIDW